ncbi:hypothetical protein HQ590_06160 [bacterium]|nr:hypothetical protein [bacterium]
MKTTMLRGRDRCLLILLVMLLAAATVRADNPGDQSWPPPLPGAVNGTRRFTSDLFLHVPTSVVAAVEAGTAVAFDVAQTAPTVELAYHGPLPDRALNGTGWSGWGDIAVASNGMVYCAVGDHGDDAGGTSRAYLFRWDPTRHVLDRIVDVNGIVPRRHGEPTWSKIHARIDEGPDGGIYFSGTLNDGNRGVEPAFKWSSRVPGAQLYRYDPRTGKAAVWANLPPQRCTATALLDAARNRWWCNLEGGPNGLFVLDLKTRKPLYQAPAGSMRFNRNFILAADGTVYFNGTNGIWKCLVPPGAIRPTGSSGGTNDGVRASTRESRDGWVYGALYPSNRLFRYAPAHDQLELLGPTFLAGEYTTVCVLSPDERFVYYLPGAHGAAWKYGTPVIQYRIATGRRKVIAFLRAGIEASCQYIPAGTYGVKINEDGSVLYVNFNGHAADVSRPDKMPASGFGLTAFAAIEIPAAER